MSTTTRHDRDFPISFAELEEERLETLRIIARAREEKAEAMAGLLRGAAVAVFGFANRWLVAPVVRWYQREQLRIQLASLDDRMLADVGLTRTEIPKLVKGMHRAPAQQPAASATLHHLPLERKPAAASAEDTAQPLAA